MQHTGTLAKPPQSAAALEFERGNAQNRRSLGIVVLQMRQQRVRKELYCLEHNYRAASNMTELVPKCLNNILFGYLVDVSHKKTMIESMAVKANP